MDYSKYLDELVQELLADETWDLPAECRFALGPGLPWGMLFI